MQKLFLRLFILTVPVFFYPVSSLQAAEPLDKVVAVVNEEVITESELNKEVSMLRQQLAQQNAPAMSEQELRKKVLQHLINMNLQLQLAKQSNITIDSSDLQEAINRIAQTNHLSITQLREAVTKQGLPWDRFQENIRKEMMISRLQQQAVGNDILITPEQVEAYLKNPPMEDISRLTYHLENLRISLPEEASQQQIESLQHLANALKSKIRPNTDFAALAKMMSTEEFYIEAGDLGERPLKDLPELFAQHAQKMQPGAVVGPLRTGNGFQIIRLLSIKNTEQADSLMQTHVRQILLKPDAGMTEKEENQQVTNIYQQIKAGNDFAQMAKKYSLDTKSADRGGDLGWIHPGELPPELENAINTLPLHQLSKPIKSKLGWHLIEVLGRQQVQDIQSIKRQQAWQFLQQRKFNEAIQNWQKNMQATAYIHITEKELA